MIKFAYSALYFLILLPIVGLLAWYRWTKYRPTVHRYPLADWLVRRGHKTMHPYKKILFFVRLASLLLLSMLILKPQMVDVTSKINVEGIDIILTMDVSASMLAFDNPRNPVSRIKIAKEEALHFISKRDNDAIGLVIFGKEAVSRCPLTLDKKVLKEIISNLNIGVIREDGTMLAKGIMVAASRLKNSKAKSKVIILLTDGEPSPEDSPIDQALAIAQQLGIKIYTIGIGDIQGGYFDHPQLGVIPLNSQLNHELLKKIARKTGGHYFEARNQQDLRLIYDHIDRLEKTDYESTIFTHYYDIFVPFVWLLILLLLIEIIGSSLIWFAL